MTGLMQLADAKDFLQLYMDNCLTIWLIWLHISVQSINMPEYNF